MKWLLIRFDRYKVETSKVSSIIEAQTIQEGYVKGMREIYQDPTMDVEDVDDLIIKDDKGGIDYEEESFLIVKI